MLKLFLECSHCKGGLAMCTLTLSSDECDCKCHTIEGMEHVVPCCGECPICHNKRIKMACFEEHVTRCKELHDSFFEKPLIA